MTTREEGRQRQADSAEAARDEIHAASLERPGRRSGHADRLESPNPPVWAADRDHPLRVVGFELVAHARGGSIGILAGVDVDAPAGEMRELLAEHRRRPDERRGLGHQRLAAHDRVNAGRHDAEADGTAGPRAERPAEPQQREESSLGCRRVDGPRVDHDVGLAPLGGQHVDEAREIVWRV